MSKHLAPETVGNALREVIDNGMNQIYGRTAPLPGTGAHRAEPAKVWRKQDACIPCMKAEKALIVRLRAEAA